MPDAGIYLGASLGEKQVFSGASESVPGGEDAKNAVSRSGLNDCAKGAELV